MPDSKSEPVPIERQMKMTPSVLREPLTTIDVESALDQELSDDFDVELAAETDDVNDRGSDLVTGMGGGDDPIVDGVEVESDLEEMNPVRTDETDQPLQSDMAPMSGHSRHRDDLRATASHLPPGPDEDDNNSGSFTDNEPNTKPSGEPNGQ